MSNSRITDDPVELVIRQQQTVQPEYEGYYWMVPDEPEGLDSFLRGSTIMGKSNEKTREELAHQLESYTQPLKDIPFGETDGSQ
jgi:hypothetical protein